MLFPGLNYIARGLWYFLPNIDEDQKKVLPFERGAPGTMPYGKSGPSYCITIIKRLDEDLRQQLLGQKPLPLPASSI